MVVSFLQILQESVQKLLPRGDHSTADLPPAAIASMAATIGVKGFIWIGCARIKTTQVQALAQDCKTDVYFNSLSLLFPLIGNKLDVWWLDPLGATILSLFIIYDWAGTCLANVSRLTGEAADDRTARKMLYMAYRFSPLVAGFKTMKAYHCGDGIWVEVDILMDEHTPLKRTHDVSETLQYCLEGLLSVRGVGDLPADSALGLSEVDRAFVTIDCKFRISFLLVEMDTDDKIVDTSQGPTGHAADNE
jgi:divalent metal cation (Fe/Co/Zn/Cd) transporter